VVKPRRIGWSSAPPRRKSALRREEGGIGLDDRGGQKGHRIGFRSATRPKGGATSTTETTLRVGRLDSPDETRPFHGHGSMAVVELGETTAGRGTFEPGWRWSQDVKPIAGTDSCQAAHVGYFVSGRMRIRMDEGTEVEFGPGDLMDCPPGHDAWIVGDDECVVIDWGPSAAKYAK
jgi:EutQ-like cupin domain